MRLNAAKRFLKSDLVKPGDQIIIRSEGEWMVSEKFLNKEGKPRKDFLIDVELGGQEYLLRLNMGNRTVLQDAYGAETSSWVGKQASVVVKPITIEGRDVNVMELRPIAGPGDIPWEE